MTTLTATYHPPRRGTAGAVRIVNDDGDTLVHAPAASFADAGKVVTSQGYTPVDIWAREGRTWTTTVVPMLSDHEVTRSPDYLDLLERYGLPRDPEAGPDGKLSAVATLSFWAEFDELRRELSLAVGSAR
jgi:hypothetical protein